MSCSMFLVLLGGMKFVRSGNSRYSHEMVTQSNIINEMGVSPTDSSVKLPVYMAMWDITYNVETGIKVNDILAAIVSSGSPGHYA